MHIVRKNILYLIMICLFVSLFFPFSSFAQESSGSSDPMLETDSTPPIIEKVYPEDGKSITEDTTLLQASIRDDESGLNLSSIVFKLDGQVLDDHMVNYMHGLVFTYSPILQNGTHIFEISVSDNAGNNAHYSSVFYVKKSVWPEGSALRAENIGMHSLTLTWTPAEGSIGYRIYWGQSLLAEVDKTVLSYEITELDSATHYDFKVEAVLPDGGWTTDGPYVLAETLPLPHFPPSIYGVYPSNYERVTTANPVIKAQIKPAYFGLQTSSIQVKVDNQPVPSSYDEKSMTLTAPVSGLENGFHRFVIHAVDNEGIYEDYRGYFQVQAVWPVGSSLNATNVSLTSLTLSWTTAIQNGGYRIYRDGELIDTVNETINSYDIKGLRPDTSYTFKVEAKGPDGKWTTDGPSVTVKTGKPSNPLLERLHQLQAALAAGDPSDMENVRRLRDEIAGLDDGEDQAMIDPVWNKIAAKLPEAANEAELKSSLFRFIKAIGSSKASDFERIRTNPEFRATIKTIAAAGGHSDLTMDDFITFWYGDGGSRKGLEGTIAGILAQKSKHELVQLLSNKEKQIAVLLEASELMLGDPDAYKLSSILKELDVTPNDLVAAAQNFRQKLQHEGPAVHALAIAYIRSIAQESLKVSSDGARKYYSLKAASVDIPPEALVWKKVSGSPDFTISPDGTVSLSERANNATAVIQAALINPYGEANKIIFQKAVTIVRDKIQS